MEKQSEVGNLKIYVANWRLFADVGLGVDDASNFDTGKFVSTRDRAVTCTSREFSTNMVILITTKFQQLY